MGIPVTRPQTLAEAEALAAEFPEYVQRVPATTAPPLLPPRSATFVPHPRPAPGDVWEIEEQGVRWIGSVDSYDARGPLGGTVMVHALRGGVPGGDPLLVIRQQLKRKLERNPSWW